MITEYGKTLYLQELIKEAGLGSWLGAVAKKVAPANAGKIGNAGNATLRVGSPEWAAAQKQALNGAAQRMASMNASDPLAEITKKYRP